MWCAMNQTLKLLDVVALLEDYLEQELVRGQVGTIVEVYEPGVFEVEFSDTQGRMYALETLRSDQLWFYIISRSVEIG